MRIWIRTLFARRLGVGALTGAMLVSSLAGHAEPRVQSEQTLPNVLIVVTDDQRAGLQVMPATRRLFGRNGKRFANGYVTTPLCCPSRASILTGNYAHNHGTDTNHAPPPRPEDMIQHRLRQEGYATGIAGKFFYGHSLAESPPGFDRWAIFKTVDRYHDYWANVDGRLRMIEAYSTRFTTNRALRFMRAFHAEDEDQPWFLMVAPFAPHRPFVAESRYENARVPRWRPGPAVVRRDRSTKPSWVRAHRLRPRYGHSVRRRQFRTLMSVDDLVRRLFAELRSLGQARDTLAFFISDHGLFWGEHGLRGKRAPYREAVRVPFLMRWPGRVTPGVDHRLVANIDIAPTILHAAGLSGRDDLDGRSLLDPYARDRLLLEYWRRHAKAKVPDWASTVRHGSQYIEYYGDEEEVLFREYYDLWRDPHQLVNVLRDGNPSTSPSSAAQAQMSQQLVFDRTCRGPTCP
jgi:arylsulfatase A-like enzyme